MGDLLAFGKAAKTMAGDITENVGKVMAETIENSGSATRQFTRKGSRSLSKVAENIPESLLRKNLIEDGMHVTGKTIAGVNGAFDADTVRKTVTRSKTALKEANGAINSIEKTLNVDRATAKSIQRNAAKTGMNPKNYKAYANAAEEGTVSAALDARFSKDLSGKSASRSAEIFASANTSGKHDLRVIGGRGDSSYYVPNSGEISKLYNTNALSNATPENAAKAAVKGIDLEDERILNQMYKQPGYRDGGTKSTWAKEQDLKSRLRNGKADNSFEETVSGGHKSQARVEDIKRQAEAEARISSLEAKGRINETYAKLQDSKADFYNTDKNLHKNRYSSKDIYMKSKLSKEFVGAEGDFISGNYENPLLKRMQADGHELKDMTLDQYKSVRNDYVRNASASDMNLRDNIGFHRLPQKAAGVGGSVWALSKLGGVGEKTNEQLYGQQQY